MSPKNWVLLNWKLSPNKRVIPPIEKAKATKKNLENFSFKMKKAKIMTITGAKFDKKVALETVVRVIDQCQHIKSSEKKVPANIKTKYWFLITGKFIFSIMFIEEKTIKKGKLKNIL